MIQEFNNPVARAPDSDDALAQSFANSIDKLVTNNSENMDKLVKEQAEQRKSNDSALDKLVKEQASQRKSNDKNLGKLVEEHAAQRKSNDKNLGKVVQEGAAWRNALVEAPNTPSRRRGPNVIPNNSTKMPKTTKSVKKTRGPTRLLKDGYDYPCPACENQLKTNGRVCIKKQAGGGTHNDLLEEYTFVVNGQVGGGGVNLSIDCPKFSMDYAFNEVFYSTKLYKSSHYTTSSLPDM